MLPQLISTTRLRLEAAHPRHLDSMRVAIESSLPELRAWMPWAIDDSRERTREFLEGAARAWQDGTGWGFAIVLERDVIGTVGLAPYDPLNAASRIGLLAGDNLYRAGTDDRGSLRGRCPRI
jgi:RimJ/RimL family protein N-acetyltransferase